MKFGFTKEAELLNLRIAALAFVLGVVTELLTGQGIIAQVLSIFN